MKRGEIIDMHAHILPRVDDGSAGFVETNHLLRMAISQGIGAVIATPHASKRINPKQIRELAAEVETRFRMEHPDFCVYPGQEIYYHEEMPEPSSTLGRICACISIISPLFTPLHLKKQVETKA